MIGDAAVSDKGRKEGERRGGSHCSTAGIGEGEGWGDREGEVVDLRSQVALCPHGDAPPEEAAWHVDVIVDARPAELDGCEPIM